MPKISLGTVYRNLSVLKDEGIVREIYGSDRRAHYDAVTTQHAHFICSECGAIGDVHNLPELDWRAARSSSVARSPSSASSSPVSALPAGTGARN